MVMFTKIVCMILIKPFKLPFTCIDQNCAKCCLIQQSIKAKPLKLGGSGLGSFSNIATVASASSLVSSFRFGLCNSTYHTDDRQNTDTQSMNYPSLQNLMVRVRVRVVHQNTDPYVTRCRM